MSGGLANHELMKNAISTYSWLALLAVAASANGQGPPPEIPGAVSTVTIGLTLTTTVDGTVKKSETTGRPLTGDDAGTDDYNYWTIENKDGKVVERAVEEVTKMSASKYSNKEMLLDLKEAKVITDIKGWSITKVQATLEEPAVTAVSEVVGVLNGPVRFYLTHKTLAPIPIDNYIGLEGLNAEYSAALALNSKRVIKYNALEETTSDVTTHTVGYKGIAFMYLDLTRELMVEGNNVLIEDEISLSGPAVSGEKLGFYGPQKLQVLVPTATKIGPVFGFAEYSDERIRRRFVSMVEGTVSFGAGVVKNVGVFPDVTVDPSPEPEDVD